jgi:hypothetical protein
MRVGQIETGFPFSYAIRLLAIGINEAVRTRSLVDVAVNLLKADEAVVLFSSRP